MPKKESSKQWQKNNPDKVSKYRNTYRKKKPQVSVILDDWVKEYIDSVKPTDKSYGQWVREFLEMKVKEENSKVDTK